MKTLMMITIIVLSDSAGDVLLTRGMKQVGEISIINLRELLSVARKVVGNKNFLSAIFFMCITFFSFLTVLSWSDLSFVFPATSLVYVVGTLGAKFILGEKVTLQRWAGTLLVCLGVALTSIN
jgi:drug/metabolite transporter (DMT)-like permease